MDPATLTAAASAFGSLSGGGGAVQAPDQITAGSGNTFNIGSGGQQPFSQWLDPFSSPPPAAHGGVSFAAGSNAVLGIGAAVALVVLLVLLRR